MEFVSATCPKCGGTIQVPEYEKRCFCTFCGNQILIDDGSQLITHRTVDEAKIKKIASDERVKLKRIEQEEKLQPVKLSMGKASSVIAKNTTIC